jgi:cytochrome d ubiquinol oxidase subunit II
MTLDLNILWYILVSVLFIGFFVLEGFDYGVGILMPFLGKNDRDRRVIINTIGPFWDGNEVWLLTAGGAIFAAFPHWYATLFSGFYLALFVMLFALIIRAVAFEFRSKHDAPRWRSLWDWCIFTGSLLPAILWGVAFANLAKGTPIDANMQFAGSFFSLLSPYTLLGGIASLAAFALYGAIFLTLKADPDIADRAHNTARKLWLPALAVIIGLVVYSYFATDIFVRLGVNPGVAAIFSALALISVGPLLNARRHGWAFITMALAIILTVVTIFQGMFPRVMISSLNPKWTLTIYNASSTPYTLQIMSIVALIFVPIVLIYQGWTYWVFRKRVFKDSELEY